MRLASKVQQGNPVIDKRVFRVMKDFDLPLTPLSLLPPSGSHSIMHISRDASIEMVDVKLVQPLLQSLCISS